jgi:hypothetical protein
MSFDTLFKSMMLTEQSKLFFLIGSNIAGSDAPPQQTSSTSQSSATPATGAGNADAPAEHLPPSTQLLNRTAVVQASLSLVGLRPAAPGTAGAPNGTAGTLGGTVGNLGGTVGAQGSANQLAPGAASTAASAPDAAAPGEPVQADEDAASSGRPPGTLVHASESRRATPAGSAAPSAHAADPDGPDGRAQRAVADGTRPSGDLAAGTAVRPVPQDALPAAARAAAGENQMAAERRAAAEGVEMLALGALAQADGQTERAGVISSFILNAAMIPGWPFPRPIELAMGRAMVPHPLPQPHAAISEAEALTYLASMGAAPGLLAKIKELMKRILDRAKLLLALAVMVTGLSVTLRSLQEELEAMEQERQDLERESADGRRRLAV